MAGGAFVGLYQGASGAADASAALKPLLPNISVYQQGSSTAPALQNQVTAPLAGVPSGGTLSKFGSFLGGLADETGHLAAGATNWLVHNAVTMAEAPIKLGVGIDRGIQDRLSLDNLQKQSTQVSMRLQTLANQFKTGQISSGEYKAGLNSISKDSTALVVKSQSLTNQVTIDQHATTLALVNTSAALITVISGGFGGLGEVAAEKLAASGIVLDPIATMSAKDYLTSKVTDAVMQPVIDTIARVASNPDVYASLDSATQEALERSTAEVVAQASTMTAGQIARTTAINVALKYPIYFNYLSTTAGSVYTELDQGKYGQAIRTVAFNAALVLSGGPIGQALKAGGGLLAGVEKLTFGEGSFWDEASKYFGDGNSDGFNKAITKAANNISDEGERREFIKNLSNLEATNIGAVGGHEVKAAAVNAASRMSTGMQGLYSTDLQSISHDDAIQDMVKFAKWQGEFDADAKSKGFPLTTVGRLDARDKNAIATAVTAKPSDQWAQAWTDWKASNPNLAAANNAGFDRQMLSIMSSTKDPDELKSAIMSINAQTTAKGFSKAMLDAAAKDGYIPIQPRSIAAPFKEGSGVLKSGFDSEFFTKSVQPLPVLSTVGQLLTGLGLSPEASNQRVYQMFTDNIARNLQGTRIADKIDQDLQEERLAQKAADAEKVEQTKMAAQTETSEFSKEELEFMKKQGITADILNKGTVSGETATQAAVKVEEGTVKATTQKQVSTSDVILKKLSSYAKGLKIPVSDMRMLTNKQVRAALGGTFEDAAEVQKAIAKAYIDIPMSVRGLGDAAVDWSYNLPGSSTVMRRYLRIQGALRFSFNPFFQYLRVIPKTEILSSAEGGGFINSIFQGRTSQVSDIRGLLREGGFLDTPGHIGNVISGEATEGTGMAAKNLTKHLLPMQERSIAGLIDSQAQKMGLSAEDYMSQNPQNVRDTVQAIAEYDKRGNFINSPLARTLNIAIFPFRFDTKVAQIFGRSLGRQSLLTQVAVVNGLIKGDSWLNSPEGQAWYSKNSTAIGILGYISPVLSINEAFESLLPGHDHHLGNFGELGGLPFGWIPQLTDSAGLTHFNQAGVDPTTGDAIPQYVPQTLKGQAAIAIQDLLGELFSYPGAEVGLPSKTSITRNTALGLTGGSKATDLKLDTPSLSPSEQNYQKNVQQSNGTTPVKPTYQAAPTGNFSALTPNANEDDLTSQLKAHAAKAKAKTKADFAPALAPGQTAYGQV